MLLKTISLFFLNWYFFNCQFRKVWFQLPKKSLVTLHIMKKFNIARILLINFKVWKLL